MCHLHHSTTALSPLFSGQTKRRMTRKKGREENSRGKKTKGKGKGKGKGKKKNGREKHQELVRLRSS
jgi:hypothetical protein